MDMQFNFSSVKKMSTTYRDGPRIVMEETRKGIERSVIQIENDAKRDVPVLTHNLQRSLTHEVVAKGNSIVGRAGTNVIYGPIVEEGWAPYMGVRGTTKGRKARPYLKPALAKNRVAITREMSAVVRRISARLARTT